MDMPELLLLGNGMYFRTVEAALAADPGESALVPAERPAREEGVALEHPGNWGAVYQTLLYVAGVLVIWCFRPRGGSKSSRQAGEPVGIGLPPRCLPLRP